MLTWLSNNLINILIIAVIVLVVGWIIRGMIRDKKAGKSCCGCNCAACGACSRGASEHKIQNAKNNQLIRTRVEVDGMMCGMCEAHVNEAIRKAIPVKKVSSSRTRGETIILTESAPDTEKIRKAINETGYTVISINSTPYMEKKSLHPVLS